MNVSHNKLQHAIDNNMLTTDEQLSLIRDNIDLEYKLLLNDLNYNIMKQLIRRNNIKFIYDNSKDMSKYLFNKYYELKSSSFVPIDNVLKRFSFVNSLYEENNWKRDERNMNIFSKQTVEDLIDEGDFNAVDENGNNILIVAVFNRDIDLVNRILPYVDINYKNKAGNTALHTICLFTNEIEIERDEIVEKLLSFDRLNVNAKNNEGRTPLMLACINGNELNVRYLLTMNELKINEKDEYDRTALIYSTDKRNEIMKMLLNIDDIDVNVKDKDGFTALIYTIKFRRKDNFMSLLYLEKTNVNEVDNEGNAPLMHAIGGNVDNLADILIEDQSVDLFIQNKAGETALDIAYKFNNKFIDKLENLMNY